jgi:hypothetical protein
MNHQWVIMPNNWRNGFQSIPYVLTGLRGFDGLGYANTVAATLRRRGVTCSVEFI